mmetsp:Transcript_23914/g.58448  ORF Transcript_23914/g.58448 Transcript_23914/m.58448 type:complete len:206 (-) Transcript_23914:462-1079(-)
MSCSRATLIGWKNMGNWFTTASWNKNSWIANPVIPNMARRPLNTSASSTKLSLNISASSTKFNPDLSMSVESTLLSSWPKDSLSSKALAAAMTGIQNCSKGACARPSFKTDGTRSPLAKSEGNPIESAMDLWKSSAMGQPTAASIAILPCFCSDLRYHSRDPSSAEKLNGSNPRSPASVPSKWAGRATKGKEADISGEDKTSDWS